MTTRQYLRELRELRRPDVQEQPKDEPRPTTLHATLADIANKEK